MRNTFFIAATGSGVGLTSVCLGLVRALDRRGIRVGFCKPISQTDQLPAESDPSTLFMKATMGKIPPASIPIAEADESVREERVGDLMEHVIEKVSEASEDVDVVIVEALLPSEGQTFNNRLNRLMASNLDADVILVSTIGDESAADFEKKMETAAAL